VAGRFPAKKTKTRFSALIYKSRRENALFLPIAA
jgi:hypothetical protein